MQGASPHRFSGAKPVTKQQSWEILLVEVGADTDNKAREMISTWWDSHEGSPNQNLLTKRDLLRYLLGIARRKVNVSFGNQRVEAQKEFDNTSALLKECNDELATKARSLGMQSHLPRNIFSCKR